MYAEKMAGKYAGCKIGFSQFGLRRSLSESQVSEAAGEWNADSEALSLAKKLVVTSEEPAWKEMSRIKSEIRRLWVGSTMPYVEPGIRLIANHKINEFNLSFALLKADFEEAVKALDAEWQQIVMRSKAHLGSLYNPDDYPATVADKFGVAVDYVSLDPPDYLMQLNPKLYEQQKAAMMARLEASAVKAEQELAERLHDMVMRLADKLSGTDDGKPKRFRKASLENIREFFEQLEEVNITDSEILSRAAKEAKDLIYGYETAELGGNGKPLNDHQKALRESIAMGMQSVGQMIEKMLVPKVGRKLLVEAPVQKELPENEQTGVQHGAQAVVDCGP